MNLNTHAMKELTPYKILPVSRTLEKLGYIDRQFVDDYNAIFDNILYNHHRKQSFGRVAD